MEAGGEEETCKTRHLSTTQGQHAAEGTISPFTFFHYLLSRLLYFHSSWNVKHIKPLAGFMIYLVITAAVVGPVNTCSPLCRPHALSTHFIFFLFFNLHVRSFHFVHFFHGCQTVHYSAAVATVTALITKTAATALASVSARIIITTEAAPAASNTQEQGVVSVCVVHSKPTSSNVRTY